MATYKDNVRAATTANITLSGTQTIDGVALVASDRVLVKDQSTASENGIYAVAAGAWSRAADANTSMLMTPETTVRVSEGTLNAHTEWSLETQDPITLGTTALSFVPSHAECSGTNVGGALEVFKDVSGNSFRYRTIDVTDTTTEVSGQQAADLLKLRPLPPGWYNVRDYGATGDGVTDDGPAIRDAIAAIAGSDLETGTLYFPRGTYKISSRDETSSSKELHNAGLSIPAPIDIVGATPFGYGVQLDFASGISGIIFEYQAGYPTLRNVALNSPVSRHSARTNSTAYVVGDKVSQPGENRYHFECVASGTSGSDPTVLDSAGGWLLKSSTTIADGTCTWAPRIHSALIPKTIVHIERFAIGGFTNYALYIAANGELGGEWDTVSLVDNAQFKDGIIVRSGGGCFSRGSDINNNKFENIQVQVAGYDQPSGERTGVAFWQHGGLGSTYFMCYAIECLGRSFILEGGTGLANACISCSNESIGFPCYIENPTIWVGGNVGISGVEGSGEIIAHPGNFANSRPATARWYDPGASDIYSSRSAAFASRRNQVVNTQLSLGPYELYNGTETMEEDFALRDNAVTTVVVHILIRENLGDGAAVVRMQGDFVRFSGGAATPLASPDVTVKTNTLSIDDSHFSFEVTGDDDEIVYPLFSPDTDDGQLQLTVFRWNFVGGASAAL